MKRIRTALASAAVLFIGLLTSCGPRPPDDRVAALVDEAESAAEARKPARLRPLLSEDFIGPESIGREAVVGIARRYLLTHRNVHVLTRVVHVEGGLRNTPIRAVVYAALAGQPIESLDALPSVKARIIRFEMVVEPDGIDEARIIEAEWRPATVEDMVLGHWRDDA